MNYLQGLAAAQCLHREGASVDISIHALGAAGPRPGEAGLVPRLRAARRRKEVGASEKLEKCCPGAVKSQGSVPRAAIPNVKLFQQGEVTSDGCRASAILRAKWSDT